MVSSTEPRLYGGIRLVLKYAPETWTPYRFGKSEDSCVDEWGSLSEKGTLSGVGGHKYFLQFNTKAHQPCGDPFKLERYREG